MDKNGPRRTKTVKIKKAKKKTNENGLNRYDILPFKPNKLQLI